MNSLKFVRANYFDLCSRHSFMLRAGILAALSCQNQAIVSVSFIHNVSLTIFQGTK